MFNFLVDALFKVRSSVFKIQTQHCLLLSTLFTAAVTTCYLASVFSTIAIFNEPTVKYDHQTTYKSKNNI